jgi:hypothetical protein
MLSGSDPDTSPEANAQLSFLQSHSAQIGFVPSFLFFISSATVRIAHVETPRSPHTSPFLSKSNN